MDERVADVLKKGVGARPPCRGDAPEHALANHIGDWRRQPIQLQLHLVRRVEDAAQGGGAERCAQFLECLHSADATPLPSAGTLLRAAPPAVDRVTPMPAPTTTTEVDDGPATGAPADIAVTEGGDILLEIVGPADA